MRIRRLPLARLRAAIAIAVATLTFGAACSSATQDLQIPFTLSKPAGNGPFPAVVILHDCSGLGPNSSGAPWRWTTRLTAMGYVTIWPDSFSTRGHADGVCTDGSEPIVEFRQRASDAYAALSYLRNLPYVDGTRIAVMGGSHGGISTLAAIVENSANAPRRYNGFAAAIALYPECGGPFGSWLAVREKAFGSPITSYQGVFKPMAPLLILAGELDDWTPAEPCRQLATRAKVAGYPVDIVVYPGAHHAFDSRAPIVFNAKRRNRNIAGGHGATTGGNEQAWADAVKQVESFLKQHLSTNEVK